MWMLWHRVYFDFVVFCFLKTISNALISSPLDYCNSLLNNIAKQDLSKLQHVQNCLARVVLRELRFSPSLPYMSTQREVFEGQTMARRAKRGGLWKGGPGVLPWKFSKTCIANGAIWVIPELYLSIQLAYIVITFASKVSFKNYRPLFLTFCLCRCKC